MKKAVLFVVSSFFCAFTFAQVDCNGENGGEAFYDDCGNCVGGSTGLTACIDFSPNVNAYLSTTEAGQVADLTIEVSQDPGEPDMEVSLFVTNSGSFLLDGLSIGDTLGYADMEAAGGEISFTSTLILSNIVSVDQVVVASINTLNGDNMGNFTLMNNNPGIAIVANPPDDGNNVTSGNESIVVFQELFLNPEEMGTFDFSTVVESEEEDEVNLSQPISIIEPCGEVIDSLIETAVSHEMATLNWIDSSMAYYEPGIHTIQPNGMQFMPMEISAHVGDTIRFINLLDEGHTATEVDSATWFSDGTISNGGFSFGMGYGGDGFIVVDTPGVTYFVCEPHVNLGMKGKITASYPTASDYYILHAFDNAQSALDTTLVFPVTESSFTLTGLLPLESYTWELSIVCLSGDTTEPRANTFTTLCDNTQVLELSAETSPISCFGATDAEMSISAINGSTPYLFELVVADTVFAANITSFSGLPPANYAAVVLDDNNWCDTLAVPLLEPAPLGATILIDDVVCEGDLGAVAIQGEGGTMPYAYNWFGVDSASISPGNYSVQITDFHGCIHDTTYSISFPDTLSVFVDEFSDALCFGEASGSASVLIQGGLPPYLENWQGLDSTQLPAGEHWMYVQDANSCVDSLLVSIAEPEALNSDANVSAVLCFGEETGSVVVTPIGGTPPYSNVDFGTSNPEALAAGTYEYSFLDANDCEYLGETIILEPDEIIVEVEAFAVSCYGEEDGAVVATATGGVAPFELMASEGLTNLAVGNYTLEVQDANDCFTSVDFEILQTDSLYGEASLTTVSCQDIYSGAISLETFGGSLPYEYTWTNGADLAEVNSLGIGDYDVLITDANGCNWVGSYRLDYEEECHRVTTFFSPNADNYNDTWEIVGSENYPEMDVKVFNRQGLMVFYSIGYELPWDGTYQGNTLPVADYYYVIDLKNGEVLKGTVTLQR